MGFPNLFRYFRDSFRDTLPEFFLGFLPTLYQDFSRDSYINFSWEPHFTVSQIFLLGFLQGFHHDSYKDLSRDFFSDSFRIFKRSFFEIRSKIAPVFFNSFREFCRASCMDSLQHSFRIFFPRIPSISPPEILSLIALYSSPEIP